MIYYVAAIIAVTFVEVKYMGVLNTKKDVAFYVVCATISICLVLFYYQDPFRVGFTEYILRYLDIGGIS